MNKLLEKDKQIKHYSDKIYRLLKEIHNKREEIKLSLLKIAELQECKVYQIPSTYDEVVFYDYVIAKDENEAKEIGITESYYDEVYEVNGSGEIYEDDIKEFK